ncbi:kinase-like domain-containing protein [Hyaloraphidium curvatum]|nr:kinase-like domain-containing protein [Hyaloraphidium curvatum]
MSTARLIKQGAEARVYAVAFGDGEAIAKERFTKSYRHATLDEKLTQRRVGQEARTLAKCQRLGIDTPTVYLVDSVNNVIYMELIPGKSVRDTLVEAGNVYADDLPKQIGVAIARLHNSDIIHGDLTTSNMVLRQPGQTLALIDFGLSYNSTLLEDKAVDLYVLERALLSSHPNTESLFRAIIEAYRSESRQSKQIISQLSEVRKRGRKRTMVG